MKNLKIPAEIILLSIIYWISILVFLKPFLSDLHVLIRYWDGPNYLYIAKTLYQIPTLHPLSPYGTTPAYFACHLPLYPLLIKGLSFVIPYPWAMLAATWLSGFAAMITFYYLLKITGWVISPFWSTIFFLFFPIRTLIYRNVGASEPLFIFLIILSIYFFQKNKFGKMSISMVLSSATRITGVLEAAGIGIYLLLKSSLVFLEKNKRSKNLLILPTDQETTPKISSVSLFFQSTKPLLWLIPVGLTPFLIFLFYYFQYNNYWAYFAWNNKLIGDKPFGSFLMYANSNGLPHSAELYWIIFISHAVGLAELARRKIWGPFYICLMFFLLNIFVVHEDMSRYMLPLAPFTWIVAFDSILQSRYVRIPLVIFGIPLAYIYAWKMIPGNLVVEWVYQNLLRSL